MLTAATTTTSASNAGTSKGHRRQATWGMLRNRACDGLRPPVKVDICNRHHVDLPLGRWRRTSSQLRRIRTDAIRIALAGLASGDEPETILAKLGALRIRSNTFPAEELLELASDAIDEAAPRRLIRSAARSSGSDCSQSARSPARRSITRASTQSLPLP